MKWLYQGGVSVETAVIKSGILILFIWLLTVEARLSEVFFFCHALPLGGAVSRMLTGSLLEPR